MNKKIMIQFNLATDETITHLVEIADEPLPQFVSYEGKTYESVEPPRGRPPLYKEIEARAIEASEVIETY